MHASNSVRDIQSVQQWPPSSRTTAAGTRRSVLPLQYPASNAPVDVVTKGKLKEVWGDFSQGWPSSWIEWIQFFFPCVRWMRIYDWRADLKLDIMAGLTVGTMLVPQVKISNAFTLTNILINHHHHLSFYLSLSFSLWMMIHE